MQLIDICANFKHILLPQNCILCGSVCGHRQLCTGCSQDLPLHHSPCCPVCALPATQGEVCGNCLKLPPRFDATTAALNFDFPADAIVRALKYQGQLEIAGLLATILAQRLAGCDKPDFILPMPLHATRLQQRGFNQAAEIARRVAHRLAVPFTVNAAVRVRATDPQAGLPLEQRRKNLRGAFAAAEDLSGKKIAVIDDVMTTGTSLNELAKTLKAAGAVRVECWVAARTLKH